MACLFYMRDTSFFFRQQISLVQIKTMCVRSVKAKSP